MGGSQTLPSGAVWGSFFRIACPGGKGVAKAMGVKQQARSLWLLPHPPPSEGTSPLKGEGKPTRGGVCKPTDAKTGTGIGVRGIIYEQ